MAGLDDRDDALPAEAPTTDGAVTETVEQPRVAGVRRFQLDVIEGPQSGSVWHSTSDHCSAGSHPSNDLVLDDPTVSRFHCEIRIDARGARLRDLGSRNGVIVDGVQLLDGFLRGGSTLRLGRTVLRFQFTAERNPMPVSTRSEFGSLIGTSAAMRSTFAVLERAADAEATVLIEGETGTGKEGAAEGLHLASPRRDGPFVVVDCGSIPGNLLETELFGHEKGAFTGAVARRIGAFEEATHGTIFLDEIGELPPELQPKLLRVLEQREVRRVGSNVYTPIDVRVVAATNRDLRNEVNAGRFRSDLYFRLAVVRVHIAPLRARPEDIPSLVERILKTLGAGEMVATLCTPEFVAQLQRAAWPGNVRELRNYLERCLVFQEALPVGEEVATRPPAPSSAIDPTLSYDHARRRVIEDFERQYVEAVLRHHQGRVTQAARAAGIDRAYLHRLMRRHGVRTQ